MKKFWVACHESGNTLSRRLGSLEEAKVEAGRLASVNRQPFVVLEAVGIAEIVKPPVQWSDATEPETAPAVECSVPEPEFEF